MVSSPECRDERVKDKTPPPPLMFSTDLGGTSLPARGLLYSVLAHVFCAVASLYVPWSYWFPADAHLATAQSVIQQHEVLFLPDLQPMASDSPAAPSNSREVKQEEARASSYSANVAQGVVYKGPQLIVSNPPHPDNVIQTIRQPDLPLRPKLPAPLQIPPLVSIAPAKPVLAPPAPQPIPEVPHQNQPVQVAAAEPILLPSQQPRVDAPKLALPPASSTDALLRTVANAAAPATLPTLAHQNQPAKTGDQAHNILVVSAIPMADSKPSVLPPGELFGAFTVSPQPVTARPGAAAMGGSVPATGNVSGAGAGTSPNTGSGPNAGKSTGGTGEGTIARAGVGSGAGAGHASGKGTGGASGTVGHGSGIGSGPGTGSGNSPFPSIMIQGGTGSSERGSTRAPVAGTSTSQGSYGITIVANGASGGGFKDFGVFRDEASYTVYLDMADAGAYGSWTLQYALDASNRRPYSHGLLVPPYATSKLLPHISSEAARRDRGATMVVFGVINPQGRFEDLRIMQSPDPGLNQLLLDSLGKWVFRPAEIDGAQVRVKVLLGVPVNSVPLRE
jgi:hypothetical protein